MASPLRRALVTGGNAGIGLRVVRLLAESGRFSSVLMGSRDAGRGESAVRELGHARVRAVQLDVCDAASVERAAADAGELDLLVNNAGVFPWGEWNEAAARLTLATNYTGLKRCARAFRLAPGGRVCNVSSLMGVTALDGVPAALRARLSAEDLAEEELDAAAAELVLRAPTSTDAYGRSKACVNALTARFLGPNDNCVTPGFCQTSMTEGKGAPLTADEGARRVVHAALEGEPRTFYSECKPHPWH